MQKEVLKKPEAYIGRIADEFTKKDLLVTVERVDDQAEKLIDLSLKGKRFSLRH